MKKEKTTEKVEKKTDIITNDKTDTAVQKSKSLIIKLEDLVPFKDHPYKVIEDDSMTELTESIAEHGILNPLLVRPLEDQDGKYEIISGHRRYHAAQKANLSAVPAFVRLIDRDEAAILLVDSNLNREKVLPSEKAFAYKLKYDALSHQGASRQDGAKQRTSEEIAESAEDSARQIQRYIRLTNLIPELLELMDNGKIAFSVGVELSFLDDQLQYDVLNACEENDNTPSYAQAVRMHKAYHDGKLDRPSIREILSEEKANQREKVTISMDRLKGKIPDSYNDQQRKDYILKACEYYHRYLQKKRAQER